MSAAFASPSALLPGFVSNSRASVRRWLENILFLHLDLWPWGSVGSVPHQAFAIRQLGGRSPEEPNPYDDGRHDARGGFVHESVLSREVVQYLQPGPGKLFLDATLGGGGHAL